MTDILVVTNIRNQSNAMPEVRRVLGGISYPGYNQSHPHRDDLALLFLESTLSTFNFFGPCSWFLDIAPVKEGALVQAIELYPNEQAVYARPLMEVEAEKGYCNWGINTFCAKAHHPDLSCANDFGGPIVQLPEQSVVGIMSYPTWNCTQGHAERFVRTDNYKEWIGKEIKKFWCSTFTTSITYLICH